MIKALLAFPTTHVTVLCASFLLMDTLEAAADALSTWVPATYVRPGLDSLFLVDPTLAQP